MQATVVCASDGDRLDPVVAGLTRMGVDALRCEPAELPGLARSRRAMVAMLDGPEAVRAGSRLRAAGTPGTLLIAAVGAAPDGWEADAVLPAACDHASLLAVARALALAADAEGRRSETIDLAMAAARVGVWEWDLATARVHWSRELEQIHGWAPGSFPGTFEAVQQEMHPDDRPRVLAAIRDALENGTDLDAEYRIIRPDGAVRWVQGRGQVVRAHSGAPVRMLGVCMDVTDRRGLDVDRAHLAAVVESLGDAIVSKGLDGTISSWNPGAERLFGYSSQEAIGRHISLIIPPHKRDEETMIIQRLRRGERISSFDTTRVARDGRLIDVSITISPVRDPSGTIIGASKVARDITGRKRAQERIRLSEERLRLAIEAGRLGVWEWDINSDRVEWSDKLHEIYGITRADFGGTVDAFKQRVHPDDVGRVTEAIRRSLEEGADYQLELRIVRPDGAVRWVATRGEVFRDPPRMIGVVTDITDRRRSEERLLDSEARERARAQELQALMDAAPVPVFIARDPECRTIKGNRAAHEILRIPEGANISLSAPPAERPTNHRVFKNGRELLPGELSIQRAARGEEVRNEELLHCFDDGTTVTLFGHAVPLRDEEGRVRGSVGAFIDATELNRVRDELARRVSELARSNAELQDFAYAASHDLKEPLRGISSYAEMLLEDYGEALGADGRDKLQALVRLPKRLYSLLDALLEYARIDRSEPVFLPIDLGAVAEASVDSLRGWLAENGADVLILPGLPRVRGDRTLIGQVLCNLITNGVKYNTSARRRVEIGAAPDEAIFVRDNGIGIAPRHHEAIFRIFKRLHARDAFGGGTGAGLAIIKKIVQMHHGRVWVESAEGMGSTFFFRLGTPRLTPPLPLAVGPDGAAAAPVR